ncbi:META domain-containing protein [Paenalcaligenes hominis]|uniref:Heat shock protein HslJ n=1 Tax=Paenalcaligenes hominis TaxID=643674 RepID=A0ABX0WMT2_9BURK|nr:META domain-containing protein [Paenalcaligenes hominis]NJB64114.1 heat shock protein HslJ [Paenalcaligenes hominis]GGE63187.1 hypothetical protein GCM10007278_09380 [Paenalcaligenes hominis]
MKRKLTFLTAAFATAGLAACSAPSTTVMTDSGKKVTLSPAETIQAYHWDLVNVVEPDGASKNVGKTLDHPLTLTFLDDVVALQNLCNNLNASYNLQENSIAFSQVVGTMKMCNDPELMQYEQEVARLLPTASTWSLATTDQTAQDAPAPVLSLHFDNGQIWSFAGKQTNEAKYGGQAEMVFLEVSPTPEMCPQSGNMCLKVRPVHYDQNGVATGTGDWILFQPNAIEGYEHVNGVGTIVRTKRYAIPNAPAGSATDAYVLDMVVQSNTGL